MEHQQNQFEIKRLHELIDRYFDATATEAEERELYEALASTELSSDQIDEARAVAGFFACGRNKRRKANKRRVWLSAAASVAVAAVCGAAIFAAGPSSDSSSSNRCIAYIGNEEITDTHTVLAMMQNDLADINAATCSLRTDAQTELAAIAKELSL